MSVLHRKILSVIFDIAAAAILVLANYEYNYRMPHEMEPLESQNGSVKEGKPSASGSEGDWKDRFSDYFSEETKVAKNSYTSPDISISVEKKSYGSGEDTVTYFVADIHLTDITYFQTGFAHDTYGVGYRESLEDMTKRFDAVLAVNGDSYSYSTEQREAEGILVRNGVVYRVGDSKYDICVLYYDGTMKTYSPEEFDCDKVLEDGAYQTWTFGPALLDGNGKAKTEFNIWEYIKNLHPRTAIGYYEPGHYCMVVVDGRQEKEFYSRGMDLEELGKVFEDLGCVEAYNLDGGHCSGMTLNGKVANHPYALSEDMSDCIYISEK